MYNPGPQSDIILQPIMPTTSFERTDGFSKQTTAATTTTTEDAILALLAASFQTRPRLRSLLDSPLIVGLLMLSAVVAAACVVFCVRRWTSRGHPARLVQRLQSVVQSEGRKHRGRVHNNSTGTIIQNDARSNS